MIKLKHILENKVPISFKDYDKKWLEIRQEILNNPTPEIINAKKEFDELENLNIEQFIKKENEWMKNQGTAPNGESYDLYPPNADINDVRDDYKEALMILYNKYKKTIDDLTNLEFEKRYEIK